MWMQIASRMATFLKVLETLKVSEAHRAMWYTSGTLEPNPTDRISGCIMHCTPGIAQKEHLQQTNFG